MPADTTRTGSDFLTPLGYKILDNTHDLAVQVFKFISYYGMSSKDPKSSNDSGRSPSSDSSESFPKTLIFSKAPCLSRQLADLQWGTLSNNSRSTPNLKKIPRMSLRDYATHKYIHFEILKLSRELNQAYTYQILLDIILQFSLLLCILYNTYFYLISLNLSEVFLDKEISITIIWISLLSTKIILINNHCTNFYREVEITAHLLRELDICYLDNSIRDEVLQFSLQLFLHPLKFTAGDYTLNNRLSTMIFNTIITYLIVLVQISPLLVR
ncbi:uncharacterized protein LOC122714126 [Apis laboriosa]|uniref:uncharacterized protein LOC122714126 n=1 Tax=Apis laboriosa TaxID=183418 RepID=UPI001CC3B1E5|nr:uncharacterized protein LOC122714126 [Apis laboriosa]